MSDYGNRPPIKKHVLHNRKLGLSAPCPSAKGKWSSLTVGLVSNNPRFTIYTNDPEDKTDRDGKPVPITGNVDAPIFFQFLRRAELVAQGPVDVKFKIENEGFQWFGKERAKEKSVLSELHFGKDKDGVCWISVTMKDRPRIQFKFGQNDFHHWYHGDGTPFSPEEVSVDAFLGWAEMFRNLMPVRMDLGYVEPKPRDDNGGNRGGGGGNYNRGGGGGGGGNYNNRSSGGGGGGGSASDDDDIPF